MGAQSTVRVLGSAGMRTMLSLPVHDDAMVRKALEGLMNHAGGVLEA